MQNNLFPKLLQFGFEQIDEKICVGTWKNYAVMLRHINGKNYYVYMSVRVQNARNTLRKTLRNAVKAAGIKKANVNQVMPNYVMAMLTVEQDDPAKVSGFLDTLTEALRGAGVEPADTCALTGAANPDSLCVMMTQKYFGFQPVNAAAVRQSGYEAQAKAEDNENNGNYLTGILGAILGALVGIAVNLLTIAIGRRIYSILFALIPVASMFGYKLFKGKANKSSIVIVCVLSLLAVPVLEFLTCAIVLTQETYISFSESMSYWFEHFFDSDVLKETGPEMLKFLLFMALGLFIGWNYVNNSLNSTKIQSTKAQMDSVRPNPNHR